MKKFVALFLTVVMLVGSLPVHTHAVDESVAQAETVSDEVIADISIETMILAYRKTKNFLRHMHSRSCMAMALLPLVLLQVSGSIVVRESFMMH